MLLSYYCLEKEVYLFCYPSYDKVIIPLVVSYWKWDNRVTLSPNSKPWNINGPK